MVYFNGRDAVLERDDYVKHRTAVNRFFKNIQDSVELEAQKHKPEGNK